MRFVVFFSKFARNNNHYFYYTSWQVTQTLCNISPNNVVAQAR